MGLLEVTAHRPWPIPHAPWVMAQAWHDLLFAHWPLPAEGFAARIPPPLELDTFNGRAWLGVVPFRMSGVRLRGTPAVPGLSAFPELNVRTYVRFEDRPGVLFLSLDAANAIAVAIARAWFHLPYFRARMACRRTGDDVVYEHARAHAGAPAAELSGSYGPRGPVFGARPGTLEHWLCERYRLYAVLGSRVWRAEIHHAPWPLQDATASFVRNTMAAAHGLELPSAAPLLHFARRQDVVVWNPARIA